MNDDKIFELFQRLADKLQENTDALKDMLRSHETRIAVLETKKDDNWKTQLLMLLAKAVVVGTVAIGSLVGASGLIAKVFGA